MSMHTFEYNNMRFAVFVNVYEPAEDSFLLTKHAAKLKGDILEIGCGCGVAAIVNAKENIKNKITAVDINEDAIRNSKYNTKLNNIKSIKFLKSNLFSNVHGKFDYILFNPPYLPTTKNEKLKSNLNLAFDGGASGRKIIDKFLKQFDKYLKPGGSVLLIVSSLNHPEHTIKKDLQVTVIEEESFFFEKLYLLQLSRKR